jgi:quercetin dioxygenase-like cupin family protein
MAYKGKIVSNSKTKQTLKFITTAKDSKGRSLEMISSFEPYSKEPALHYHPFQYEYFTILKGELTVRLNGRLIILQEGEFIDIPKNTVHSMWNNSNTKTVVSWKTMPALKTEYFLETAAGLANDNKTYDDGVPGILQVSLLANKYKKEFRLAKPPYFIQRIIFSMLMPFAVLAGKKAVYKKYID